MVVKFNKMNGKHNIVVDCTDVFVCTYQHFCIDVYESVHVCFSETGPSRAISSLYF